MAVSKKGMRKVNHKGRQYLWYVNDVDKWVPDQGFVEGDPHAQLKVEGPQFPRQPGAKMVEVPRWKHDMTRYPKADFVRRLIGWCMETDR